MSVFKFFVCRSFKSLVKVISRYFVLFDVIVNWIVFFLFLMAFYCLEM